MKAKELDTMVNAMRTRYHKVGTRVDVTDTIWYLEKGLRAIGRNELADELIKLYEEIESIDTMEITKIGTFRIKE
jgi:hypothetical protein